MRDHPDWFQIDEIDDQTWVISEDGHWEQPHCYLLAGTNRAILIDTGLGIGNLQEVVNQITQLPVFVVTTHVHWDHIGGHRFFEAFAVHESEKGWIDGQFPLPLSVVKQNLLKQPCCFPMGFNPGQYRIFQGTPTQILRDGDLLDLGGRVLSVIHTPGHSPGHCCFYEMQRQYLYSGDLIYLGTLDAFYPTTNPDDFFHSVKRLLDLPMKKILPGHFSLNVPLDLVKRITEAFEEINQMGMLSQGSGIFDFGDFQIHL